MMAQYDLHAMPAASPVERGRAIARPPLLRDDLRVIRSTVRRSSDGRSGRAMVGRPRAPHDAPKDPKEQDMESELMERRSLELLIRSAEAEERLLERRLERMADEQWRTRRAIHAQLGAQPWNRLVG
jgi:hypothetical protein